MSEPHGAPREPRSAPPEPNLAALIEYTQLTLLLHQLTDLGLGNGALAGRVRDAMGESWQQLTPAEVALVDDLGAHLQNHRDLETAAASGEIAALLEIVRSLPRSRGKSGEAAPEGSGSHEAT